MIAKRVVYIVLLWSALIAIALGAACCIDPNEKKNVKSLFVYMPWSTDLYDNFETNIADLEAAIVRCNLRTERVVVFLAESPSYAKMFEVKIHGHKCNHVILREYNNHDHTSTDGLTEILSDFVDFAPAERYAMIVGGHGMAWLPVGTSLPSNGSWSTNSVFNSCKPRTRYFGGLTKESQTDIHTLAESSIRAGVHWDYILFDGCFMSSIEVAYNLKDIADYIIASPTEILTYGMPYNQIGEYLIGEPDYEEICAKFHRFYSSYTTPCGTLSVICCPALDNLAAIMQQIVTRFHDSDIDKSALQPLDGFEQTIFYDLNDYVEAFCADGELLAAFHNSLSQAIPYHTYTDKFYSETAGTIEIKSFCGISTSAPSESRAARKWNETSWYKSVYN